MFELDPRLAADTVPLGRLPLCRVLLMDDSRYPWLVLVPALPGLSELHELEPADRHRLMDEAVLVSRALLAVFQPDKINTGCLGNQVAQLHMHVIARFRADSAWPGPVWGSGEAAPYPPDTREAACKRLRGVLSAHPEFDV